MAIFIQYKFHDNLSNVYYVNVMILTEQIYW